MSDTVPSPQVTSRPTPAADLPGWRLSYSGKVRELYLPQPGAAAGSPADVVLVVASDRISAFDHILATPIPDKGKVLTAMTLWWFERLADVVDSHLVSTDVPPAVAGRAMICRRLDMFPIECVARGYLTGSGLAEYRALGSVCGVELPEGLVDGSRLPAPVFTPATKAAVGDHDENVSLAEVANRIGARDAERLRELTLALYARAEEIARERGIILADTKFEFGRMPQPAGAPGPADGIVLGDEVLTPDSSRFWPADSWQPGRPQPSFDKQFVRDWLADPASGWDRAAEVPPPPLPPEVVERTRERYLEAFVRLTGTPFRG